MKAIVFDLDNTLIIWKDEYVSVLKKILPKYISNISDEKANEIDKCLDDYENVIDELSREKLLFYINNKCKLNLSIDFIDELIKGQRMCFQEDKKLEEVIKYLASKYDLYVVSNWFTETQEGRLENVGVLKYFKKVYGADINYLKPDIRAFKSVFDKYSSNSVICVGDSLNNDILPVLKLGGRAIWISDSESNKYETIHSIYELEDLL